MGNDRSKTQHNEADGTPIPIDFEAIAGAVAAELIDRNMPNARTYASWFQGEEAFRNQRLFYENNLGVLIDDLDSTTGCDVGCWYGLSTLAMIAAGAGRVYGVDVVHEAVAYARDWAGRHLPDALSFREMLTTSIPLQNASVDWAVMNQIWCNDIGDRIYSTVRETLRILRPGGTLVLCDSNNPYCPSTWDRLWRVARRNELGEGTATSPDGGHFKARIQIIEGLRLGLEPDKVRELARQTCYLWGEQIIEAARRFAKTGQMPGSVFSETEYRPTIVPRTGWANGKITDPYEIEAILSDLGFHTHICVGVTRERVDEDTLYADLQSSEGFYVIARKPS